MVVEYEPPAPEGPAGLKAWVQQHKAERPGAAALQKQVGVALGACAHACAPARLRACTAAASSGGCWPP
jgi:hypothetical protein